MRIGAFELAEPVPQLDRPRLLVTLRPWIDVGSVGTLAMAFLEEQWAGQELGRFVRPGDFFDFTRYRPTISNHEGRRIVTVPNTVLRVARGGGADWLLLNALEPHARGEDYRDTIVEVARYLGVAEYVLIGAMYGPVPHTRPPVISGSAANEHLRERFERLGVRASSYEGPTTIVATIPEELSAQGVATASMLVQLPAYAQLETDHLGRYTLLSTLSALYGLSLDLDDLQREGERQYAALDNALETNPALRGWVRELEAAYDREASAPGERGSAGAGPRLSNEMERFLKEVERGLEGPGST